MKSDDTDYDQLGSYMKQIADMNGVSVATVSDGWVLLMTHDKLQYLVEASAEKGYAMIFIKNSADTVKN